MQQDFESLVGQIMLKDNRYDPGAYFFVREALEHTIKNLRNETGEVANEHVSGPILLNGIKDYALRQYGPMTLTLLQHWRVKQCEDFGEIVFNMVDFGILGKTDEDSRSDFRGGYDFKDAFEKPYLPGFEDKKGEAKEES